MGAIALLLTAPAGAQPMPGMTMMPGMDMSAHHAPTPSAPKKKPAAKAPPVRHEHPAPPMMTMPDGHTMPMADMAPAPPPAPEPGASGTDLPVSNTPSPAPAPPRDHAADALYAPAAMAAARKQMHAEHGGMAFHRILFNLAEAQVRAGRDGYRWDAEGWWGGDIDRLVVKSEGDGTFGRKTDAAEVQALYSRAMGPYTDLQAGVRQDLGPGPRRTYATVGVETLAPYMLQLEGALFLSDHGDLLARAEGWYDQRLTQRLILQPRVELNFAAQDVPAQRIGAGLTDAELGLRLRYEITRRFAPYLGVSWTRRAGDTARLARAAGEDAGQTALALGIRSWF